MLEFHRTVEEFFFKITFTSPSSPYPFPLPLSRFKFFRQKLIRRINHTSAILADISIYLFQERLKLFNHYFNCIHCISQIFNEDNFSQKKFSKFKVSHYRNTLNKLLLSIFFNIFKLHWTILI